MAGESRDDGPESAAAAVNFPSLLFPEEVWGLPQTRKALVERDLTGLYRLARRYGYSQTRIAQSVGKSQPQVSEIMNSKVPHRAFNLDVVHRHANAFRMPLHARLLFLGITAGEIEQEAKRIDRREELKRRELLRAALALSATGIADWQNFSQRMIAKMTDRDYLKWFAWELHLNKNTACYQASLPPELAEWAVAEAALPVPGFVCRDEEGRLRLVDHALKDILIAQTLSADILLKESTRFALVQTSHATDRILGRFIASERQYEATLQRWMTDSPDPILRVNSAGVLAKTQESDVSEAALGQLGKDVEIRQRYTTAVASRVLGVDWGSAERRAQLVGSTSLWRDLPSTKALETIRVLTRELSSSADAGARWCSAVLLSSFRDDYPGEIRDTFHEVLPTESSREVLRVVSRSLAGKDALA
jgi:transcriptional regulator with XRE-family HTH domain